MGKSPLTPEQRERLKQTLASGSRLGASDLRLINVDAYKERLGANWFKYKAIIHAYAAEAIKAELASDDFFVETKGGYGIFFFKKAVDEVQVIAERIAERLQRQLSREPAFGDPPLGCEATSVNCIEFLQQLENDAAPAGPKAHAPAAAPPDTGTQAAKYTPLWHAKYERVVGSIYAPQTPTPMRRLSDNDYYTATPIHARQDIGAFNAMLGDAYKLHKQGMSTTIVFSVNFKTFCAPQFNRDYMLALRQTPGKLLPFLTPRFVRIPPGTPQTLLATKVQLLATIFRRVVLHTRPLFDTAVFEFVPCSIISTSWKDIEQLACRDPRSQRTPGDLARIFCQSAKKLRVNALIEGLHTLEALETAIGAGVDFASGASIKRPGDAPLNQCALPLDGIRSSAHAGPARPPVAPPPAAASPVDEAVFEIQ